MMNELKNLDLVVGLEEIISRAYRARREHGRSGLIDVAGDAADFILSS